MHAAVLGLPACVALLLLAGCPRPEGKEEPPRVLAQVAGPPAARLVANSVVRHGGSAYNPQGILERAWVREVDLEMGLQTWQIERGEEDCPWEMIDRPGEWIALRCPKSDDAREWEVRFLPMLDCAVRSPGFQRERPPSILDEDVLAQLAECAPTQLFPLYAGDASRAATVLARTVTVPHQYHAGFPADVASDDTTWTVSDLWLDSLERLPAQARDQVYAAVQGHAPPDGDAEAFWTRMAAMPLDWSPPEKKAALAALLARRLPDMDESPAAARLVETLASLDRAEAARVGCAALQVFAAPSAREREDGGDGWTRAPWATRALAAIADTRAKCPAVSKLLARHRCSPDYACEGGRPCGAAQLRARVEAELAGIQRGPAIQRVWKQPGMKPLTAALAVAAATGHVPRVRTACEEP
jgi:hypothetical protein